MATTLTRSKDRKVTNAVRVGTKLDKKTGNRIADYQPLIANAFGLPSGKQFSCTDQTDFCSKICYAGKLEKIYKGVSTVLLRNFDALKDASLEEMTTLLGEMIADFVKDCDKRQAEKLFRIHWDGDFFSGTYVAAWSRVIADNPDVQFWAYTRVQTAAAFLHSRRHANLSLYFSADEDNIDIARAVEALGIRIAFVGQSFADGKAAFGNATPCPENNRKLPLIAESGSACVRCGLCVNGRRNVLFSVSKR
jgi:hypothetical protein